MTVDDAGRDRRDGRDEPTADRALDVERVAGALDEIRSRIDAVERSWTHPVEVVAVTKAKPAGAIAAAVDAGCAAIGESYAQELLAKTDVLDGLGPDRRPRVDFIGRLQSNKVRGLVGVVDRWCSVDRSSLVDELAKRAAGAHVLVQVSATGEEGKGGCPLDRVADLVGACRAGGLVVDGLMAIGPTEGGPSAAEPGFRAVRELVDELGLEVCSMGMTGDLEVAVAAGATSVRIGSALLGERPAKAQDDEGAAPSTQGASVRPDGGGRG